MKYLRNIGQWVKTYALDKRVLFAVVLIALTGGAIIYFSRKANTDFTQSYTAYAEHAARAENAALVPGVPNNPIRQQLNQTLSQVLASNISAASRLTLSQGGEQLLETSGKQIDNIGTLGQEMNVDIEKMDLVANSATDFSAKTEMRSIVALAQHKAEIIEDIRGLSYRANFETKQIFDRIIQEDGKLTNEHVSELNNELPDLEDQFNKRQNLYNELQAVDQQISDTYNSL